MSYQIPHFTVNVKISDNQTFGTKKFTLPYGFVLAGAAYPTRTDQNVPQNLELTLKQDNVEMVPAVNIQNWKQTGGEYEKSFKPLNFDTQGKEYTLILSSSEVSQPGLNPEVQVVFIYDTKQERIL